MLRLFACTYTQTETPKTLLFVEETRNERKCVSQEYTVRYMCGVPWCVPANTTLAELLKRKQVKWKYVFVDREDEENEEVLQLTLNLRHLAFWSGTS